RGASPSWAPSTSWRPERSTSSKAFRWPRRRPRRGTAVRQVRRGGPRIVPRWGLMLIGARPFSQSLDRRESHLSLYNSAGARPSRAGMSPAGVARTTVFLIEDDNEIRESLTEALEEAGLSVSWAP